MTSLNLSISLFWYLHMLNQDLLTLIWLYSFLHNPYLSMVYPRQIMPQTHAIALICYCCTFSWINSLFWIISFDKHIIIHSCVFSILPIHAFFNVFLWRNVRFCKTVSHSQWASHYVQFRQSNSTDENLS